MKIHLLLVVVWLFLATNIFASNEITGKKLPSLVKASVKVANSLNFSADYKSLDLSQVVLVQNMAEFCQVRGVTSSDCAKFGQAFVINTSYPIYINADSANTPSQYANVVSAYESGMTNISFFIAALLVHEEVHAQGEASESLAYQRELQFVESAEKAGLLKNAIWLPGYLENLNSNLLVYKNEQVAKQGSLATTTQ